MNPSKTISLSRFPFDTYLELPNLVSPSVKLSLQGQAALDSVWTTAVRVSVSKGEGGNPSLQLAWTELPLFPPKAPFHYVQLEDLGLGD